MKSATPVPVVTLAHVKKSFWIPAKNPPKGIWNTLFPQRERFDALKDVSFSVKKGTILGYIGPNGAGKSTTIKLMTGILTADEGTVNVMGHTPWTDRLAYTEHIGVVFGQKGLLWWDLPPQDSFLLYKSIYGMNEDDFQKRSQQLIAMFDAQELVKRPTRKLSLGERMRCEIIAALLHKPEVLFLDEPTIGLDAMAKAKMREAIRELNEKENITIVLTTHDMADIEALAHKIIVLDQGTIIFEGKIEDLKKKHIKTATIAFELNQVNHPKKFNDWLQKMIHVKREERYMEASFSTTKNSTQSIADALFECTQVESLQISEPSLEDVIRDIYGRQRP